MDLNSVVTIFQENQMRYELNLELLVKSYHQIVLDKYKPYLHRWFIEAFPDPTQWLEARTTFTRSAAVWSVVGHIVGTRVKSRDEYSTNTRQPSHKQTN